MNHQSSTTRREEDELLQYAHVPRNVRKTYAVRYFGRPSELPHFFAKYIDGYQDGIRHGGYHETIRLVQNEVFMDCNRGDWITVSYDVFPDERPFLGVSSDSDFRNKFIHVRDLSFT